MSEATYQDLFSGKTEKLLIGINPWNTGLYWRKEWEPRIGKEKYDAIEGCGVYEITHQDFVKICEGISKYKTERGHEWSPDPAGIAAGCDEAGTGNRWFGMSDVFTEFVAHATPIMALADFVD